ncbi:MAG TPA: CpsD/CapB family tyrosine-protein kinase [Bacteroidota bacterium]
MREELKGPVAAVPSAAPQLIPGSAPRPLDRPLRSIIMREGVAGGIDGSMIGFEYYNCFNYSLLTGADNSLNLTLGITSASRGEGKTVVACNLAVSLALACGKETVLVDLNLEHPRLHDAFGIPSAPGLSEALHHGPIHLSRTSIEHLSVLTAGGLNGHDRSPEASRRRARGGGARASGGHLIGLENISEFREIILALEERHNFVIVDMPSIDSNGFPILYSNELNGLLVVVDSRRTRRPDIEKLFRLVHKRQVLGFVFNRFEHDEF